MNERNFCNATAQTGAVLVVSLLILSVMTLIGVTGLQSTTLEERMAGNLRDGNLAFQAAEAALRDAEDFVEDLGNISNFNGAAGLYGEDDADPDYLDAASWSATSSKPYLGSAMDLLSTQPRYIVKHVGLIEQAGRTLNLDGYGDNNGGDGDVQIFRITARGTGGSDTARAIVQAQYGKIF